jgi:integrase
MTTIKLRYIDEFVDGQGRVKRYFRRRRSDPRIALPGIPGSDEFNTAYAAALTGKAKVPVGAGRVIAGTIAAAITALYQHDEYTRLRPISRKGLRNVLERIRVAHGHRLLADLRQVHVEAMLKGMTPGAANKWLRTLKQLCRFAIKQEMMATDPTFGVRKREVGDGDGFHEWTEREITQYQQHWAVGTRQRLALDLLLYTAQRRSDVVKMGERDIGPDDTVHVVQSKTGAEVWIPILPHLRASLDAATKAGHQTFLVSEYGKPYSSAGFGIRFHDWCIAAGLSGCSAHGLRKAATRRMAEAGFTDEQMMAWTGHTTRAELTRYSKGASRRLLARTSAVKLNSDSQTGV